MPAGAPDNWRDLDGRKSAYTPATAFADGRTASRAALHIESPVPHDHKNIPVRIRGRPAATLPDSTINAVRSRVEHGHLLERSTVIANHPTVIRPEIAKRSPAGVYHSVQQQKSGTRIFPFALEVDVTMTVGHDLEFDVVRVLDELLDVNTRIAEGLFRFGAGSVIALDQ